MKRRKRLAVGLVLLALLAVLGWSSAASLTGSGPENAQAPSGDWVPLRPGESHWYSFYYAGDGSQVEVRLQVEPPGGAAFAVWTPEEIRRRGLGVEAEPVGRGSADPNAAGSLVWSGHFDIPGTYYVVVEYAGNQPGPSYYLLTVSGTGVAFSTPTPTPPPPKPAPAGPKSAVPAKPGGKLVFQTTIGGDFYTINVDGSGLRRITDGVDAIWSPDGKQIAFSRWRQPRGVWVINADGSGERRIFDWNETRWPSWSADGSRILFTRQKGGRLDETEKCFFGFCFTIAARPYWRFGVVRLSDGDFREPPSPKVSKAPMWAPPGAPDVDRIVFNDEFALRVQSEDESVSYRITQDYRDIAPAWSPDGQRVAFTRRQHDHWEVYVVDADGRNLRRLTNTPKKPNGQVGSSAAAAWSPDGHYLAFLTDRAGKWEIWLMRADGSEQRPMFAGQLDGLKLEYAQVGDRAISWAQ